MNLRQNIDQYETCISEGYMPGSAVDAVPQKSGWWGDRTCNFTGSMRQ